MKSIFFTNIFFALILLAYTVQLAPENYNCQDGSDATKSQIWNCGSGYPKTEKSAGITKLLAIYITVDFMQYFNSNKRIYLRSML